MNEEPPVTVIEHAAHCTRCKKPLVLKQDPDCPALHIQAWIAIIVCDRCGKYLERLRAIDDKIASVANKWSIASGSRDPSAARSECSDQLVKLTQSLMRLLMQRWGTTDTWSMEVVEMLLDNPDKTRIAVRHLAKEHQTARQKADSEATKQGRMSL